MIQMIVTDLDGTLLRTDNSVSAYTKEILAHVRNKGIKTAVATARGKSARRLAPPDLFDAFITENGAKVFVGDALLCENTIAPAVMRPFLQKLTDLGIKAAAEIDRTHHANFIVSDVWSHIDYFKVSDFTDLPGNADKLYAVIEKQDQTDMITSILPQELYMHVARDGLAMLMHKDATKANAVRAVAQHWGIDMRAVAAFGDDVNDIEMLRQCGFGVAMQNALDEVKAVADEVCDPNDNDGVAKWLAERI